MFISRVADDAMPLPQESLHQEVIRNTFLLTFIREGEII